MVAKMGQDGLRHGGARREERLGHSPVGDAHVCDLLGGQAVDVFHDAPQAVRVRHDEHIPPCQQIGLDLTVPQRQRPIKAVLQTLCFRDELGAPAIGCG